MSKKTESPARKCDTSKRKNTSISNTSCVGSRTRKRKREMEVTESDLESELEDCDMKDVIEIETRLRKVARKKSLTEEEMKKLLQKVIKNEHILALVTLKAEDELSRERKEKDKCAIVVTDSPVVPKLTRSKARQLIKKIPQSVKLDDASLEPEILKLIRDDLHSDEDDEDFTPKDEEELTSDDEPNTTASEIDSNPCTPQTPATCTGYEESPVKLTADGCFKIPEDKINSEPLIAARTRSKLCLEKTTLEDLESQFIPPDLECLDLDVTDIDNHQNDKPWFDFLNDFTKPLNNNNTADDDDPVNDPEYVAAERVPVDAEELRNIEISKKEVNDLLTELYESFIEEGISLENIDFGPVDNVPILNENNIAYNENVLQITEQTVQPCTNIQSEPQYIHNEPFNTSLIIQNDNTFQPNVMSTPSTNIAVASACTDDSVIHVDSYNSAPLKTITIPHSVAVADPEMIAIPIPGATDSYRLVKVVPLEEVIVEQYNENCSSAQIRKYGKPYDNNFTFEYISIKRHIFSEYEQKFENLRHLVRHSPQKSLDQNQKGITREQYDILQQQLRIHVQFLTQTYLQVYSHPILWKDGPKIKSMLDELETKSKTNATFNAWNLHGAQDLITKWQTELSKDTVENKEMMQFIHKEVDQTNKNTRQVTRFPPRIMDLILDSNVFMYPQYLPRMPFGPRSIAYNVFAPSESILIALGLDKHLSLIEQKKEKFSKKKALEVVACERLINDTIFGKTGRRVYDYMKDLRKRDSYNPVKYFFEYKRAPPIEHDIITFPNGVVLTPRERIKELPLAWQHHIKMKNQPIKKRAKHKSKVSSQAGVSYSEFVREILGDQFEFLDENCTESEPEKNEYIDEVAIQSPKENSPNVKSATQTTTPNSLIINVNYMFGEASLNCNSISNNQSIYNVSDPFNVASSTVIAAKEQNKISNCTIAQGATKEPPTVAYNFDVNGLAIPDVAVENKTSNSISQLNDNNLTRQSNINITSKPLQSIKTAKRVSSANLFYSSKSNVKKRKRKFRNYAKKHKIRKYVKRKCLKLLKQYQEILKKHKTRYNNVTVVQNLYIKVKALELYSDLLIDLRMFCQDAATNNHATTVNNNNASSTKRSRVGTDADAGTTGRNKKLNKQEENLRQMLLPESEEVKNRKDAIYAFNFYEKVEEVFLAAGRLEDYKSFNEILRKFDPSRDKVADLYHEMENLFLPDYPELAEVFLTFLMPSEAAEIGKFFEHFMITNITTFVNKLNIYFSKQPAQIRKIYNCLNELAEDKNVTIKQIETKIVPLLRGNQFLIDWFLQQFPDAKPPERLYTSMEHVNLKDIENNQNGEFFESISDLLDSPNNDQQPACQLRYINGRIFYGTKIALPAKLTFMATKYTDTDADCDKDDKPVQNSGCVHAISAEFEKHLAANPDNEISKNGNEISNCKIEEDISDNLVIDIEDQKEFYSSPIEICDSPTLHAHTIRLNPHYYAAVTSTPTTGHNQVLQPNAKRTLLPTNEESKLSPRKHSPKASSTTNITNTAREKRKSPTKKCKSPIRTQTETRPFVIIPDTSPAIACAKKLKDLISSTDGDVHNNDEHEDLDCKQHFDILGQAKYKVNTCSSADSAELIVPKVEICSDMEFLSESSDCSFSSPVKQIEIHQNLNTNPSIAPTISEAESSNSDKDAKLDVVATLATGSDKGKVLTAKQTTDKPSTSASWTRDEDKIILVEMSSLQDDLYKRIGEKLTHRTIQEIQERHSFLINFLTQLQAI